MTELPWTPQQFAFFDRLASTDDSILLQAVAGGGKTSTLCEGVRHLRGSVLAVAFNVRIKKVLEERIGARATVKTLNGLGHGALISLLGRRPEIKADKVRAIAKELLKRPEYRDMWDCVGPALRMVSQAKSHGLVPAGSPGLYKSLIDPGEGGWEELAATHDIPLDQDVLLLARELLRISNNLAWKGICDFDDQLYLPICWGAAFTLFDNVLVDEGQDLNDIQHRMLRKSLRKTGRMVASGDSNQAIYGWRGAKLDSLDALIETFDLCPMDLTVSFRCAQAVVREAQTVVPRIEASPTAPIGEVLQLDAYDEVAFADGDVILCRNNAPLINTAYRLIGAGRGVCVLGRDIGAGMKFLVKKLSNKNDNQSIADLRAALGHWLLTSISKAEANEQWSKIERIEDRANSLRAIIDYSEVTTAGGVIREITRLFSKDSAPITLSTVHRAKGLEWDRVFFLDAGLIPSHWSVKAARKRPEENGWMLQEETNIFYVAVTRARKKLTYINSKEWQG